MPRYMWKCPECIFLLFYIGLLFLEPVYSFCYHLSELTVNGVTKPLYFFPSEDKEVCGPKYDIIYLWLIHRSCGLIACANWNILLKTCVIKLVCVKGNTCVCYLRSGRYGLWGSYQKQWKWQKVEMRARYQGCREG